MKYVYEIIAVLCLVGAVLHLEIHHLFRAAMIGAAVTCVVAAASRGEGRPG